MDTSLRAESIGAESATWSDAMSAVSWGSIVAGAFAASAISLALLALGTGLGLSSVSPWTDTGVSSSTFNWGAGVYLVLVAVMSSAIGGYLAARLRTKWTGLHTNEVFFRDTAHGFIAWALATLLSATALAAATTHILAGAAAGAGPTVGQGGATINPAQVYVDRLFRTDTPQAATPGGTTPPPAGTNQGGTNGGGGGGGVRAEVTRLWTTSFSENSDLAPADRTYIARLVAARTGLSQPDAEKRVDQVVTQAKADTDRARRAAAKLAFWLTAALLFGAFAASLAAAEGGQYRDGTWNERRLVPRAW